jgi:aldose 1-epimerase
MTATVTRAGNRGAPPSGKQFLLELGDCSAVVTEVGAGLRSYRVGGEELLDGFGADEMCSSARGQTFIPWPNRIADGRYTFAGIDHELPLTEPAARNAIHGLTRWADWHLTHANGHSVRMQHLLHPRPGYPFALRCQITYRLRSAALVVETSVTDVGATACPYATGAHPYVALGSDLVDELTVEVPAASYYPTDDRGIPFDRAPVDGTPYDLRAGERLGGRILDNAFTDLATDDRGGSTVTVRSPLGRELALWMDDSYRYVELFTGDSLPDPSRRRRGLGIEPMTAAPNAFRSGDGLVTLEPGQTHTATWELRPGGR